MTREEESNNSQEIAVVESFAKFLETVPAGEFRVLPDDTFSRYTGGQYSFRWPALQLHCSNNACGGLRYADNDSDEIILSRGQRADLCTHYSCRNCKTHLKLFAVVLLAPGTKEKEPGTVVKVGELPLFGPHVPKSALELLGEDIDQFRKGLRSESQGLGIAAAAYYRRVVENQRTHLFNQIILAAESVNADAKMVEKLKHLREHWRFQQSIDEIKDCLPQILLIEGQNPLELLHPVLSDSLHDRTDEEALEIASEIRLVLINLAERIALAKTQSDELKQAVAKLAARKAERRRPAKSGV